MLAPRTKKRIVTPDWVWDCLADATDYREHYITKGYGAGGTFGLALWHYNMCRRNKRSELSWCVAPTFQQTVDTLIPAFTTCFEMFGLVEGKDYEVNVSSRPLIRLPRTGQEIHFKSAHRPDRLVGATISHLSGTEPGLWPEVAFERSYLRVRCPLARVRQIFVEGTPEGLGNGYERRANFAPGVDEVSNRRRVLLWTEDNPVLSAQYVEQIRKTHEHDPQKLLAYTRGEFTNFSKGSAYWNWSDLRNISREPLELDPHQAIIFGWDFGVSPLAWVAGQYVPFEREWTFSRQFRWPHESDGKSKGIEDACAEFIFRVPPEKFRDTPIEIDGGHDGHSGSYRADGSAFGAIADVLKKRYRNVRIVAPSSAPMIRDRLELVNKLLVYERCIVDRRCTNLITSFGQTNTKDGVWELDKKSAQKDKTHFSDAAGMSMYHRVVHEDFEEPNRKRRYGTN